MKLNIKLFSLLVSLCSWNTLLSNKNIVEYTLPDYITTQFHHSMKGVYKDPYTEWDFYKHFSKQIILETFSSKVLNALYSMRDKNSPQVIVLHNCALDTVIPETPRDGLRPTNKGFISESFLLGLCSLLDCVPVATTPNAHISNTNNCAKNHTSYIHQIIPLDDERSKMTQSSSGSRAIFGPHTEAVQYLTPIKFFLLSCLRGDPKVATSLIFVDDLLDFIQKSMNNKAYKKFIKELQKPQFIMRDSSDIKTSSIQTILPILRYENNQRIFRFNSNGARIEGINPHAQTIVDYLKDTLNNEKFKSQYIKKFYLKKGDILIFNNLEILHARDSFEIDYDNWRWLQRVYCCSL